MLNKIGLLLLNKQNRSRIESYNAIEQGVLPVSFAGFDNAAIHEIIEYIKGVKNILLIQSARIDEVKDIRYRNGGADTCDVMISALQKKMKTPTYDMKTGEVK